MQILKVLCETAVAVRTKALKCLTAVIEADPAILARVCMLLCACYCVPVLTNLWSRFCGLPTGFAPYEHNAILQLMRYM